MVAKPLDGGVWLNTVAADAIHLHLEFADRLPDLARQVADARVEAAIATQAELHKVDKAQGAARIQKLEANQETFWKRLQLVGGGAAITAAGFLIYGLVHR